MPSTTYEKPTPDWPQPDDSGRYQLKPEPKKVVWCLVFTFALALASFSRIIDPRPLHLLDLIMGWIGTVIFGTMTVIITFVANAVFLLSVDDFGFILGRSRCDWADVPGPFFVKANSGRFKLMVNYPIGAKMAPKFGSIINVYPMTSEKLADFLNAQRDAAKNARRPDLKNFEPLRKPKFRLGFIYISPTLLIIVLYGLHLSHIVN
jgi:hypothetical protein